MRLKGIINSVPGLDQNCWVAGSAAMALNDGESEYNDIDIFFETEESFLNVKNILMLNDKFEFAIETDQAVTFSYHEYATSIQLIKVSFEPMAKIFERFDIKNCKIAYNPVLDIWLDKREEATDNTLVFSCFENSSIMRIFKYLYKGFNISQEDLEKVIEYALTGKFKPLYDMSATPSIESIKDYILGFASEQHRIDIREIILCTYSDRELIELALFSSRRRHSNQALLHKNFIRIAKTETQKMAFKIWNSGYKSCQDWVIENYPELLLSETPYDSSVIDFLF